MLFVYYNVLLCWEYLYVWCFWETATITQDIGSIRTWTRTDGHVFRNFYKRPCWITWLLAVFSVKAGSGDRKLLTLLNFPKLLHQNSLLYIGQFCFSFFTARHKLLTERWRRFFGHSTIKEMPTDYSCDNLLQSLKVLQWMNSSLWQVSVTTLLSWCGPAPALK